MSPRLATMPGDSCWWLQQGEPMQHAGHSPQVALDLGPWGYIHSFQNSLVSAYCVPAPALCSCIHCRGSTGQNSLGPGQEQT